MWGTATAAHQIEGGLDNSWTDFEAGSFPDGRPHIKNQDRSTIATDSWNRFDEDLVAMKALGSTTYRFSVEWSRLEPRKGEWNDAAMQRYREWCVKLRAAGIEPMVTLHHFSLPKWVVEAGGWKTGDGGALTITAAHNNDFALNSGGVLSSTGGLAGNGNGPFGEFIFSK